jgi:hypothetical protein
MPCTKCGNKRAALVAARPEPANNLLRQFFPYHKLKRLTLARMIAEHKAGKQVDFSRLLSPEQVDRLKSILTENL